nr:Imm26 family immunity protein [uncultured Flavobacterium sp.]
MKLKEGDVFEFSISENSKCYGQIVNFYKKDAFSIVIFEGSYRYRPDTEELLKDNILLFGNTFDAKFYHKHWIVIDNITSNLKDIKFPYYKIGTDPVYVQDFFDNKLRKAKANEKDVLDYKTYNAPVGFELAMKAYYKIIEWSESYDEMLYSNVIRSIDLVKNN